MLSQAQEAHLAIKPSRPNASTCSSEEWAIYSRAFSKWDLENDLLVIDALKPTAKLNGKLDAFGGLFLT